MYQSTSVIRIQGNFPANWISSLLTEENKPNLLEQTSFRYNFLAIVYQTTRFCQNTKETFNSKESLLSVLV